MAGTSSGLVLGEGIQEGSTQNNSAVFQAQVSSRIIREAVCRAAGIDVGVDQTIECLSLLPGVHVTKPSLKDAVERILAESGLAFSGKVTRSQFLSAASEVGLDGCGVDADELFSFLKVRNCDKSVAINDLICGLHVAVDSQTLQERLEYAVCVQKGTHDVSLNPDEAMRFLRALFGVGMYILYQTTEYAGGARSRPRVRMTGDGGVAVSTAALDVTAFWDEVEEEMKDKVVDLFVENLETGSKSMPFKQFVNIFSKDVDLIEWSDALCLFDSYGDSSNPDWRSNHGQNMAFSVSVNEQENEESEGEEGSLLRRRRRSDRLAQRVEKRVQKRTDGVLSSIDKRRSLRDMAIVQRVRSAFGLAVIIGFHRFSVFLFEIAEIPFSSSVFGFLFLAGVLLALSFVKTQWAEAIRSFFQPAVDFLLKWTPLFFVPRLVALPVTVSLPDADVLWRVAAAMVIGFVVVCCGIGHLVKSISAIKSLFVTKVKAARKLSLPNSTGEVGAEVIKMDPPVSVSGKRAKSRSRGWNQLRSILKSQPKSRLVAQEKHTWWLVWQTLAMLLVPLHFLPLSSPLPRIVTTVAYLATTFSSFMTGQHLPQGVRRVLNPVLFCGLMTALVHVAVLNKGNAENGQYLTGDLYGSPGAGDIIELFLGPAIIALGVPVYVNRRVAKVNLLEIATSIPIGVAFILLVMTLLSAILGIPRDFAKPLLLRFSTTAIALSSADQINAEAGLVAVVVVLTGILGSLLGQAVLSLSFVRRSNNNVVARGVAMGMSGHAIATAALLRDEPQSAAISAIVFPLAAVMTYVFLVVPPVQSALLALL